MKILKDLLEETNNILKQQIVEQQSCKCFNSIELCCVGEDEMRHSAIIAELLNPQGSHGLKTKSLEIFFEQLNLPELAKNCADCEVRTEIAIPGMGCTEDRARRMDIVISGHNLCVVIENKTKTQDHYRQLSDYWEWLNKQPVSLKALLYLTYHGNEATDKNISRNKYVPISYKRLIPWLNECKKQATEQSSTAVADFFQQYTDFINKFLIKEKNSMEKKLEELLKKPENYLAAKEIARIFPEIQRKKYIELFNSWAEEKANKNSLQLSKLESDSTYSSFTFKSKKEQLDISFEFANAGFRNFTYGLRWVNDSDHGKNPPMLAEGWNTAPWWPYWKYFQGKSRNPIEYPEFLENAKELYAELDRAFKEMEELVNQLPQNI